MRKTEIICSLYDIECTNVTDERRQTELIVHYLNVLRTANNLF